MKQKQNTGCEKKGPFVWIISVVFAAMLLLNFLTPMIGDDFAYCNSFATGEPITNVFQIFPSQYAHYHSMNGRVFLHFIAQLTLLLPHWIFKILNSAMFVILGILMYQHIQYGREKKPLLLVLIYAMLWAWIPIFGETVLWQDGACNYLWGSVIILAVLLPYRVYMDRNRLFHSKLSVPGMFLAGVAAGWCNENTSAAACMVIVLMLVSYALHHKKIPAWSIAGLVGAITGFGFMILAPANFARAEYVIENGTGSFLSRKTPRDLFMKFIWLSHKIEDIAGLWLVMLTIFLVAYLIFRHHSIKAAEQPTIYLLAGLVSTYAMMIPPMVPERTFFGVVVFWIIGLCFCLSRLDVRRDRAVTMALMVCLLCVVGTQYAGALKQNMLVFHKFQQRIDYVEEQKEQGNLDLELDYIEPHGAYCAWGDLSDDPDDYYNKRFADYYGLHSAVTHPPKQDTE